MDASNEVNVLARQVTAGIPGSAEMFRRLLLPALVLMVRHSTPSSISDHDARRTMFRAARQRSAATTRLVDVDRSHMLLWLKRFMRTRCIQQSLANRIPRSRLVHQNTTLLF